MELTHFTYSLALLQPKCKKERKFDKVVPIYSFSFGKWSILYCLGNSFIVFLSIAWIHHSHLAYKSISVDKERGLLLIFYYIHIYLSIRERGCYCRSLVDKSNKDSPNSEEKRKPTREITREKRKKLL